MEPTIRNDLTSRPGPDLHTLVDQGDAETFEAAKAAAEEALRSCQARKEQG